MQPGKRGPSGAWALELEATDVLAGLGAAGIRPGARRLRGPDRRGRRGRRAKLVRKGVALVVLNDVSRRDIGFDSDHNGVVLVAAEGGAPSSRPKRAIAAAVLDRVEQLLSS